MQIDQETKRTMAIPHLSNKEKESIMKEKYMATMKPVSGWVLERWLGVTVSLPPPSSLPLSSLPPLSLPPPSLPSPSLPLPSLPPSLQLLWVLEHLAFITNQFAETPNERNFQAQYGETISSAIQRLRNPVNYSSPQAVWEPFKEVSTVQAGNCH